MRDIIKSTGKCWQKYLSISVYYIFICICIICILYPIYRKYFSFTSIRGRCRSMACCSPWCYKDSDTTEWLIDKNKIYMFMCMLYTYFTIYKDHLLGLKVYLKSTKTSMSYRLHLEMERTFISRVKCNLCPKS